MPRRRAILGGISGALGGINDQLLRVFGERREDKQRQEDFEQQDKTNLATFLSRLDPNDPSHQELGRVIGPMLGGQADPFGFGNINAAVAQQRGQTLTDDPLKIPTSRREGQQGLIAQGADPLDVFGRPSPLPSEASPTPAVQGLLADQAGHAERIQAEGVRKAGIRGLEAEEQQSGVQRGAFDFASSPEGQAAHELGLGRAVETGQTLFESDVDMGKTLTQTQQQTEADRVRAANFANTERLQQQSIDAFGGRNDNPFVDVGEGRIFTDGPIRFLPDGTIDPSSIRGQTTRPAPTTPVSPIELAIAQQIVASGFGGGPVLDDGNGEVGPTPDEVGAFTTALVSVPVGQQFEWPPGSGVFLTRAPDLPDGTPTVEEP